MINSTVGRPVKVFYIKKVLVGIIRDSTVGHTHIFFNESGGGRELTSEEFWDRMKRLNATESFVSYRN
jgi:hypothetical protein